ncbi:hypothetical protein [Myroides odoratimimus]|uniref:hypothetical protein n=1 Tax=Myroides odoratimimus TaxID=76832 RepID=UPI003100EA2D
MGQYTENGGAKRLFVEEISFYTPRILHVLALYTVMSYFEDLSFNYGEDSGG